MLSVAPVRPVYSPKDRVLRTFNMKQRQHRGHGSMSASVGKVTGALVQPLKRRSEASMHHCRARGGDGKGEIYISHRVNEVQGVGRGVTRKSPVNRL